MLAIYRAVIDSGNVCFDKFEKNDQELIFVY